MQLRERKNVVLHRGSVPNRRNAGLKVVQGRLKKTLDNSQCFQQLFLFAGKHNFEQGYTNLAKPALLLLSLWTKAIKQ